MITFRRRYSDDNRATIRRYTCQESFILRRIVQSGTTVHSIALSDLENLPVSYPSKMEQLKIALFLSLLDKKVEKQREKIEKLEEQKKSFMQKIFSRKIRFKDENGEEFPDWKEKRLEDLFSISAGGDLDKKLLSHEKSSKYPYPVSANGIENKGELGYYTEKSNDHPAFTVTARGTIGHAYERVVPFKAVGRLLVLTPIEHTLSCKFFTEIINTLIFYNETTGVPQLTAPTIRRYIVKVPSYAEQEKVSEFLYKLDAKFCNEVKKLTDLKEQKKGFMQQMFI